MELVIGAGLQGGKYRILRVLGQGGFGITYLAEQVALERKVAIKEFFMKDLCNRDGISSYVSVPSVGSRELVDNFKTKFLKEARLIATFSNSHIISIFDVFEENGTAYYVMEYLEGKSLAELLKEQGMFNEAVATKYISQVADALAEVHSNKLLHLDVKPANIMLDKRGNAVLIDFGISKHYDDAGSQTSSGLVGLSEGYAPMEQYKKGGISSFMPATDIYSLGATYYKLLTGNTPPHASDINDDGLPELPQYISPAVRYAISAAMQPRRKERPQSIEEFLALLNSPAGQSPSRPAADSGDTVIPYNSTKASVPQMTVGAEPVSPLIADDEETVAPGNFVADATARSVASSQSLAPSPSKKSRLPLILVCLFAIIGACALFWILKEKGDQIDKRGRSAHVKQRRERKDSAKTQFQVVEYGDGNVDKFDESSGIVPDSAIDTVAATVDEEVYVIEAQPSVAVEQVQNSAKKSGISTSQKVDLGLSVCWGGYNIGASSPEGYGGYYAWGETSTKADYYATSSVTYAKAIDSIGGNYAYDVATSKWGRSWRLPTKAEFDELCNRCTWDWTTYKGVNGYKVTGPNGNSIFLPAAGYKYDSSFDELGSVGRYWSSTPDESDYNAAYGLYFNESSCNVFWYTRNCGRSVRAVSTQ